MAKARPIFLIGFAIWSAPLYADIQTFATFMPTLSADNIAFQQDGSNSGGSFYTVSSLGSGSFLDPGQPTGMFTFLQDSASDRLSLPVAFMLAAHSDDSAEDVVPGRIFVQPGIQGYFEFRYLGTTPLTLNNLSLSPGGLILRGDFDNATFTGRQSGTAAGLTDSTLDDWGGIISYSSDIIDFTASTARDFALSLTSATPSLKTGDGNLRSFNAEAGGSFSSDVFPTFVSSAPEPDTWAMMLAGFGVIGAIIRRRRTPTGTVITPLV